MSSKKSTKSKQPKKAKAKTKKCSWELRVWVFDVEDEVIDQAARSESVASGYAFDSSARDLVYEFKTERGARSAEQRVKKALGKHRFFTDVQPTGELDFAKGEVNELVAIVPLKHGTTHDRTLDQAVGVPHQGIGIIAKDRMLWWRFPAERDLEPLKKTIKALGIKGLRLNVWDPASE
jgi:hypothetical protein